MIDINPVVREDLQATMGHCQKTLRNVIDKLQAHSRTRTAIIAAQAGIVVDPVSPVVEAQLELGP